MKSPYQKQTESGVGPVYSPYPRMTVLSLMGLAFVIAFLELSGTAKTLAMAGTVAALGLILVDLVGIAAVKMDSK